MIVVKPEFDPKDPRGGRDSRTSSSSLSPTNTQLNVIETERFPLAEVPPSVHLPW